ncbi:MULTISPECIES: hypothetical protein [unclassified Microcoleus]|uniref:hypothetical protein n=1 Tax=unclassified Microcoleus TaxID=2642155 RepID=UPI002FD56CDD
MPPIPTVTVKSGYKPQSIDTSIEADVLVFQLLLDKKIDTMLNNKLVAEFAEFEERLGKLSA